MSKIVSKVKRVVAMALCGAMLIGGSVVAEAAVTQDETGKISYCWIQRLGDVNNDGKINSSDALLVLKYSAGNKITGTFDKVKADVNFDGKINAADANYILKIASGQVEAPYLECTDGKYTWHACC